MTVVAAAPSIDTLAELVERLGGVPLERIRFRPYPGTATEEDVIFEAGVVLVWMVDPGKRRVTVFTSPADSVTYGPSEMLDGGNVLPGFSLAVDDSCAELDRRANK